MCFFVFIFFNTKEHIILLRKVNLTKDFATTRIGNILKLSLKVRKEHATYIGKKESF